jgi:mitotic-spindle organizing protein 1
MATLMKTGLDRETTALLINLCEAGANPEALAVIVKELRRETAMLASTNPSTLSTSPTHNDFNVCQST